MAKPEPAPSRRAIVYCVVPRDLAPGLHEPLRRFFRDDPGVEVVIERRAAERRGHGRRAALAGDAETERRLIRAEAGRRIMDRRATVLPVPARELPRAARLHAERLVFLERLEPTSQALEDADTAAVVARFQSGDREAFSILYMRYFDRVFSYLRVLLRDVHRVEDATQQVFTQVFVALPRYERRDRPLRSWLFVIVRNVATEQLRKDNRLEVIEPEVVATLQDESQVHESGDDSPALGWITDRELGLFIERLPLPQRQVIAMRYMLDMSTEEIAQVLERTPESVRTLNSRALAFLRVRLEAIGRCTTRGGKPVPALLFRGQARVVRARRFALVLPGPTR